MRASYGLLAQLVEQRTLNPFVAGSIPAQPTNKKRTYRDVSPFSFLGSLQRLGKCGRTIVCQFTHNDHLLRRVVLKQIGISLIRGE